MLRDKCTWASTYPVQLICDAPWRKTCVVDATQQHTTHPKEDAC